MNPASTPSRVLMTSRPAALVACAVLAVILNAGVIGMASKASSLLDGVAARASKNWQRVTVVLVSPLDESAAPAATRDEGAPINPIRTPRRPPSGLPVARTVLPAAAAAEPPHQVLFYTFREVDTPAFPKSDWNLDVESLDQIGVQRLVFEVLISDRGEVIACTVLEPSDLADDIKRSLEKRLSETPLQPALRVGQFVASVRRIELHVTTAPLETRTVLPVPRP